MAELAAASCFDIFLFGLYAESVLLVSCTAIHRLKMMIPLALERFKGDRSLLKP